MSLLLSIIESIIEYGETSFGAEMPDVRGGVAAVETREEVLADIQEAIKTHLEAMREDGTPIPQPTSDPVFVDVPTPAPSV